VGRVFLAFLVAVVLLLATVIVAVVALLQRGQDVIARWQPAVALSSSLLADAVNEESSVRGFALSSGNPALLKPYVQYRRQADLDRRALGSLIGSSPQARARLDAVHRALAGWQVRVADQTIADVRAGNAAAAEVDRGERIFDRVRSASAELTGRLLATQRTSISQRRTAAVLVWVALGLFAAAVVAAGAILWRGLRTAVLDPVERLAAQARAVAAGDTHLVIRPTGPPEIAELGADVDRMRARIADELIRSERASRRAETRSEELARSNADLEQFAYVASHDLSEPLRKVANFCQLLERQYAPQLDDKARQYIHFAVDGAKRMQILIGDLLAFSRVGRTTERFVDVDLREILDRALANLEERVASTEPDIVVGRLPVVQGDPSLLTALLQNLVGNALKYRSDERPHVELDAELSGAEWVIKVSDNGIGIEPQYADRIFVIFQRLHLRDQYGGTGIGLALCRKIVEFHGGRIWLDTELDRRQGATFCFTLPVEREQAA
jgi:signal transduction histidine kinase